MTQQQMENMTREQLQAFSDEMYHRQDERSAQEMANWNTAMSMMDAMDEE